MTSSFKPVREGKHSVSARLVFESAGDIYGQQFWCYSADIIFSISELFFWSDLNHFSSRGNNITALKDKHYAQLCNFISEHVHSHFSLRALPMKAPAVRDTLLPYSCFNKSLCLSCIMYQMTTFSQRIFSQNNNLQLFQQPVVVIRIS